MIISNSVITQTRVQLAYKYLCLFVLWILNRNSYNKWCVSKYIVNFKKKKNSIISFYFQQYSQCYPVSCSDVRPFLAVADSLHPHIRWMQWAPSARRRLVLESSRNRLNLNTVDIIIIIIILFTFFSIIIILHSAVCSMPMLAWKIAGCATIHEPMCHKKP